MKSRSLKYRSFYYNAFTIAYFLIAVADSRNFRYKAEERKQSKESIWTPVQHLHQSLHYKNNEKKQITDIISS